MIPLNQFGHRARVPDAACDKSFPTFEPGDVLVADRGCVRMPIWPSSNSSDYLAVHSEYLMQGRHHAGIILAQQQRYSVGEQMRRLLRIINFRSAEAMQDQVEFLSTWG